MIEISWDQISPTAKSIFDPYGPAGLRCIAVLEGIRPGRIFSDSSHTPNWVVVWESIFGTIYLGGNVSERVFRELIYELRKEKVVYPGLRPDDLGWRWAQPEFDDEGWVLDFFDRVQDGRLKKFIENLPEGTNLCPINESIIERSVNRDLHLSSYHDTEKALDDLVGVFLMKENEILCEAVSDL